MWNFELHESIIFILNILVLKVILKILYSNCLIHKNLAILYNSFNFNICFPIFESNV